MFSSIVPVTPALHITGYSKAALGQPTLQAPKGSAVGADARSGACWQAVLMAELQQHSMFSHPGTTSIAGHRLALKPLGPLFFKQVPQPGLICPDSCADKRALMRELKQHTCALLPEGIAGIFLGASVERERIFIKSRKGFVKLAIQAGVGADLAHTLLY